MNNETNQNSNQSYNDSGIRQDINPASINPTPVNPTPVNPTPVNPTPVNPTPVNPTPVSPTPVNPTPVNPTPVNPAPVSNETNPNLKENTINAEQPTDPAYLKQPVKVTEKKKRKVPLIILIILLLLVGGFTTYFILNNPQKIFNMTIDKTEKEINNYLDEFDMDKYLTNTSIQFNSDNKELEQLTKYKYDFKSGIDNTEKNFEAKIYLLDDKNKEYSASAFVKKSNLYILLSSYDKLINLNSAEENEYKNIFENIEKIKNEDIKYLTKLVFKTLKENLNKNNFSRTIATIKINDKETKAIKNSYKLDNNENNKINKAILQKIYNDEKALKITTNLTEISKEILKEMINKDEQINNNSTDTHYINIYTNFLGKVIGYDIETNNKVAASYYQNNNTFDIIISDYNYHILGIKKDKKINVVIKEEEQEIATLNFDKYSKNNISFKYDTKNTLEKNYTGKVTFTKTSKNKELTSKLNIKINDQKNSYEINVDLNKNKNYKIANIDDTKAIKLTDEEFQKVLQDFITSLNETPLGNLLTNHNTNNYSENEQSV